MKNRVYMFVFIFLIFSVSTAFAAKVAVLGDSITYGRGGNGVTYPSEISKNFGCEVVNFGKPSDTTVGMLNRACASILNGGYTHLVFMGGVNDISLGYNPDITKASIKSICDNADTHGIKVILCTVLPDNNFNKTKQAQITELNNWIKTYSISKGYTLIDTNRAIRSPTNNDLIRDVYNYDGVHLNSAGYRELATLFNKDMFNEKQPPITYKSKNCMFTCTQDKKNRMLYVFKDTGKTKGKIRCFVFGDKTPSTSASSPGHVYKKHGTYIVKMSMSTAKNVFSDELTINV